MRSVRLPVLQFTLVSHLQMCTFALRCRREVCLTSGIRMLFFCAFFIQVWMYRGGRCLLEKAIFIVFLYIIIPLQFLKNSDTTIPIYVAHYIIIYKKK